MRFYVLMQLNCMLSSCYFQPLYELFFSSLLTEQQIFFVCLLLKSITDLFVYIFEFCVKSLTHDRQWHGCFLLRAHQFSINHTNLPKQIIRSNTFLEIKQTSSEKCFPLLLLLAQERHFDLLCFKRQSMSISRNIIFGGKTE